MVENRLFSDLFRAKVLGMIAVSGSFGGFRGVIVERYGCVDTLFELTRRLNNVNNKLTMHKPKLTTNKTKLNHVKPNLTMYKRTLNHVKSNLSIIPEVTCRANAVPSIIRTTL